MLAVALLAVSGNGCYFARLGERQLALVNDQQPLPRAIVEERDPVRRTMLTMVPALRSFARNTLQLPVGHSYAGYFATEDTGILFVLVASERTRFAPYKWWFPIVGEVSYKSFPARGRCARRRPASLAGTVTTRGSDRSPPIPRSGFFVTRSRP